MLRDIDWLATCRRIVWPFLSGSSSPFYSYLTSALWSFETSVITSRYSVTSEKTWIFNSAVVRTSLLVLVSAVRRILRTFQNPWLWRSAVKRTTYCGILTVTEFIDIIKGVGRERQVENSPVDMHEESCIMRCKRIRKLTVYWVPEYGTVVTVNRS